MSKKNQEEAAYTRDIMDTLISTGIVSSYNRELTLESAAAISYRKFKKPHPKAPQSEEEQQTEIIPITHDVEFSRFKVVLDSLGKGESNDLVSKRFKELGAIFESEETNEAGHFMRFAFKNKIITVKNRKEMFLCPQ